VPYLTAPARRFIYTKKANVRGGIIMAASNNNDNSNRGFASMNEDKQREIASKGGKASAKSNKGAAGSTGAARRGGENSHKNQ
jgi:uncharacterized protein